MSFADFLLGGDDTGDLHAVLAAQQADLDAAVTWGVYLDGRLLSTHAARFLADLTVDDEADASDLPKSRFDVRPVVADHEQVAA